MVHQAVKSKGGLVLGIALQGDTTTALRDFQKRNKTTYPIVLDTKNKFGKFIEGIPLTIVVDRKGVVREVHDGFEEKVTAKLKSRYLNLLSSK